MTRKNRGAGSKERSENSQDRRISSEINSKIEKVWSDGVCEG